MRALYRADYDRGLTAAREALGDAAFTAAWNEGRKMNLEEAVAYALDIPTKSQEQKEAYIRLLRGWHMPPRRRLLLSRTPKALWHARQKCLVC